MEDNAYIVYSMSEFFTSKYNMYIGIFACLFTFGFWKSTVQK